LTRGPDRYRDKVVLAEGIFYAPDQIAKASVAAKRCGYELDLQPQHSVQALFTRSSATPCRRRYGA